MIISQNIFVLLRKIVRLPQVETFFSNRFPLIFTLLEWKKVLTKDEVAFYLDKYCDLNKVSVDVGVLWGAYTYGMLKHSSSVVAIEANPNQISFLNNSFSRLKNKSGKDVRLTNVALSSEEGVIKLRVPVNQPGNATIESGNNLSSSKRNYEYDIKRVRLDSLGLKNVGLIKIDVEGHELDVLKGSEVLLKDQKPNLLVESEERHKKNAVADLDCFLRNLGYVGHFYASGKKHSIKDFDVNIHQNDESRGTKKYINNFLFQFKG